MQEESSAKHCRLQSFRTLFIRFYDPLQREIAPTNTVTVTIDEMLYDKVIILCKIICSVLIL